MCDAIISRRSLEGTPSREEVFCRAPNGEVIRNVCLSDDGRERIAVKGLWLPLGLPGPDRVRSIPPCVWQTHKSQAYINSKPRLRAAQNSWTGTRGLTYKFCDDTTRDRMVSEFSTSLFELYKDLPLEVMKSDVWRYVALYTHGGVYADVDTRCLADPSVLWRTRSWLVVAPENCQTNYLCQWVFAAPKGSPVIGAVIREMERRLAAEGRIDRNSFVRDPHLVHRLTGPAMFTDAVRGFWFRMGLPVLSRVDSYRRYPSHFMAMLPRSFHKRVVHHLSIGSTSTQGWQAERDRLVVAGGGVHPRPARRLN